jgi:hypothetical protein
MISKIQRPNFKQEGNGGSQSRTRGNKQPWVRLLNFCAKCNDLFDSWKFCIWCASRNGISCKLLNFFTYFKVLFFVFWECSGSCLMPEEIFSAVSVMSNFTDVEVQIIAFWELEYFKLDVEVDIFSGFTILLESKCDSFYFRDLQILVWCRRSNSFNWQLLSDLTYVEVQWISFWIFFEADIEVSCS